jgi:hypothetical protein
VWASDEQLNVIDGLAFLADGSLYVNNFATGKLFRIPVKPDGSAGPIVPIETSMPLVRPDGLRSAGPRTLIQAGNRDVSPRSGSVAIARRCG